MENKSLYKPITIEEIVVVMIIGDIFPFEIYGLQVRLQNQTGKILIYKLQYHLFYLMEGMFSCLMLFVIHGHSS